MNFMSLLTVILTVKGYGGGPRMFSIKLRRAPFPFFCKRSGYFSWKYVLVDGGLVGDMVWAG